MKFALDNHTGWVAYLRHSLAQDLADGTLPDVHADISDKLLRVAENPSNQKQIRTAVEAKLEGQVTHQAQAVKPQSPVPAYIRAMLASSSNNRSIKTLWKNCLSASLMLASWSRRWYSCSSDVLRIPTSGCYPPTVSSADTPGLVWSRTFNPINRDVLASCPAAWRSEPTRCDSLLKSALRSIDRVISIRYRGGRVNATFAGRATVQLGREELVKDLFRSLDRQHRCEAPTVNSQPTVGCELSSELIN